MLTEETRGTILVLTVCGLLASGLLIGLAGHLSSMTGGPLGSVVQTVGWPQRQPSGSTVTKKQRGGSPQQKTGILEAAAPKPAPGWVSCGGDSLGGYQQCRFTDNSGQVMNFLFYAPSSTNPAQRFPLVLVLHGSGEEAMQDQSPTQALTNLVGHSYVNCWVTDPAHPQVPSIQSAWPSFVVVPQLVYPDRWVDVPGTQGSYQMAPTPSKGLQAAKDLLDTLQQQYASIDSNRLYVTGISMGGYGSWEAAERWPSYFAAAVPISGGGDPSKAYLLKDLPIWDFQGADDLQSLVASSNQMIQAIQAAGGHPKQTIYPNADHEIWASAYNVTQPDPASNLFVWLFAQKRTSGPN